MSESVSGGIGASGLDSPIARRTIVAGAAVGFIHVLIEAILGEADALGLLASAATIGGAVLLTSSGAGPLRRSAAVSLLVCITLGATIALLAMNPVDLVWTTAFASYLAGLSTARGNTVIGGIGCGVLLVMLIIWGIETHRDLTTLLIVLAPATAGIVVGYGWYWLVRRFVRRERAARDAAADSAAAAAASAAAAGVFSDGLREIAAIVEPLLATIETGLRIDSPRRDEFAMAEADVRDRIRVPRLQHPRIRDSVTRARRRGVRVELLGEPDGRPPLDDDASAQIAEILDGASGGRVTIRALPAGRAESVTVLAVQDGVVTRRSLPA